MHLRLSIVFEKFLKEKNKSKKDRSFAPPAAESRALPEREGEPPPPGELFPRSALLPRAPLPNGGPGNRKKRAAALSRPPFVPPLLWERFFLRRGQSAKRSSVHSLCRKFFMRFQSGLPGPPDKKLYARRPRSA